MTWFAPCVHQSQSWPDVKAGALESIVIVRAAELGDALPAASVAMAVIVVLPSLSAAGVGTLNDQFQELSVVVVPSDETSAKSSTELLALHAGEAWRRA